MDQQAFDRLTKLLDRGQTRRAGIRALVVGLATGFGMRSSTLANPKRRHEKLACRNANSECTSNDQCCSGSCVPKTEGGTGFRCAKRHKKEKQQNGSLVPLGARCVQGVDTCEEGRCERFRAPGFDVPSGTFCVLESGEICPAGVSLGASACKGINCSHANGDQGAPGICGEINVVEACGNATNSCDGTTVYLSGLEDEYVLCMNATSGPAWAAPAQNSQACTQDADCPGEALCMTSAIMATPCGAIVRQECALGGYLCETVNDCPGRSGFIVTGCEQLLPLTFKTCVYQST